MSPHNMSISSSKYSRTKMMTEEQRDAVAREAAQAAAETQAYTNISAMYNGQLPEGDYRNLAGNHFKINAHGCRRTVSPQEQILPLGYTWVPMNPRGEVGKPFVWETSPDYPWLCEWQPVKSIEVGFNVLGMVADPNGVLLEAIQLNKVILEEEFSGFDLLDYKVVQEEPYDEARPWWAVSEDGISHGEIPAFNPPLLVNLSSPAPQVDFGQEEVAPQPQLPSGDDNEVEVFGEMVASLPEGFEYVPPSNSDFAPNMTENDVAVPLDQDPEPDMAAGLSQADIQQILDDMQQEQPWHVQAGPQNNNAATLPDDNASGSTNKFTGFFDNEAANLGGSNDSFGPFMGYPGDVTFRFDSAIGDDVFAYSGTADNSLDFDDTEARLRAKFYAQSCGH